MENEAPKRRGRPRKNVLPEDQIIEAARIASPERPPLRDALRDEDPRAALARRVAEIESVIGDADFDSADEFAIDKRTIPDGWDYEWKTFRAYETFRVEKDNKFNLIIKADCAYKCIYK